MKTRTPIFVANWKMNRSVHETPDFVEKLQSALNDVPATAKYDVAIAPPATHLATFPKGTPFALGAQNCGTAKSGAFTGEISPAVLKELGVEWVIVGHSERRHVFKEDDSLVLLRTKAALEEGLSVILCVGEILQERKSGKTFERVESQLSILKQPLFPANGFDRLVIAYEPVWAIGTGENATPQQAQEVHAYIRGWLLERVGAEVAKKVRIQYGGSVKPDNAAQLMAQPDVDGFLVGGASLDPVQFAGVIKNGLKSVG